MKIADIRKLDTKEIAVKSSELRDEITDLRRRLNSGELSKTSTIRTKRKDLARMLTVLSEQLAKENM